MSHFDTKTPTTIWVCLDCEILNANGEISEHADKPPLGLLKDGDEITGGMLWEEHTDDCPNRAVNDYLDECGCETDEFSWSPCEGCGSTLGGSRHALTVWTDKS